jgi:C4-dicarboxylate-specific signal transduction histidine kinase
MTVRRTLALLLAIASLVPLVAVAVALASGAGRGRVALAGLLAAAAALAATLAVAHRTAARVARLDAAARDRLLGWNEALQREVGVRTEELRQSQARLVEAQKLAALGQLGAGVAHEINNPLAGILGNAQLLLEALAPEHPDREAIARIEALARRCRDVTETLLRFSQQSAAPDFREVDLNRTVRDALTLAEGYIRAAGIGLEVVLAEPSPVVRGDGAQLAHVLLGLLSNARTACLGRASAWIRVSTRRRGEEVELAVADGGKGIPPANLPRIFEPFFTTKDQWSNVGLGLSVAYRIVAEHGGRILVESREGIGSTFAVRLPPASG